MMGSCPARPRRLSETAIRVVVLAGSSLLVTMDETSCSLIWCNISRGALYIHWQNVPTLIEAMLAPVNQHKQQTNERAKSGAVEMVMAMFVC